MKPTINLIITIILSFVGASAQFRSDIPVNSIPTNINGELNSYNDLALFDPSRFSLKQSFSMSMASNSHHAFSTAGFTNSISYLLNENLKLDADITIYKSQLPVYNQGNLADGVDLSYNAGITYQPTKNSFLTLRFQKIPYYQRYQNHPPFNMRFIK